MRQIFAEGPHDRPDDRSRGGNRAPFWSRGPHRLRRRRPPAVVRQRMSPVCCPENGTILPGFIDVHAPSDRQRGRRLLRGQRKMFGDQLIGGVYPAGASCWTPTLPASAAT